MAGRSHTHSLTHAHLRRGWHRQRGEKEDNTSFPDMFGRIGQTEVFRQEVKEVSNIYTHTDIMLSITREMNMSCPVIIDTTTTTSSLCT